MPQAKYVTEYTDREFDTLVITTFGLLPDYSVVAAEEWDNNSSHPFEAQCADASVKEAIATLRQAVIAYDVAMAANTGGEEHVAAIKQARINMWRAVSYKTHVLFADLVEHGIIEPGQYAIWVCW